MDISDRKEQIIDLYYNPSLNAGGGFNSFYCDSVLNNQRNPASFPKLLPHVDQMSVQSFRDKYCVLLYSGGKESFLTSKILDYYDVKHEKLFFDEIGDIRSSEKHECYDEIVDIIKSECDHVERSTVLQRYVTSNRFGRNFPITYWYILEAMRIFPDSTIIVGGEWLSEYFLYNQMKFEHSDVLYYDLNNDADVCGSVYSIVNSMLEFDVYRVARNCFDYIDRWSYYDHAKKEKRIGYFNRMNSIIDDIVNEQDIEFKKDVLSEFEFICPQIRLITPYAYDFRKSISVFLNAHGL